MVRALYRFYQAYVARNSTDYLDYDFVVLPSMGYLNNKKPQTDVKDPVKLDLPVI